MAWRGSGARLQWRTYTTKVFQGEFHFSIFESKISLLSNFSRISLEFLDFIYDATRFIFALQMTHDDVNSVEWDKHGEYIITPSENSVKQSVSWTS